MFYTYAHYTPEGRLFYIGKGQGRRAHRHYTRNLHWKNVVTKYGQPDVQILAHWDTEEEALSHEILLISCFRELGHNLCNMTDGGEGTTGMKLSEAHKQKISKALKGRPGIKPTPDTLEKLRTSHLGQVAWNKGRKGIIKQSAETKEKISKALLGKSLKFIYIGTCIENGKIIELAGNQKIKAMGFSPEAIRSCLNTRSKKHNGYTWDRKPVKGNICH